jgi:hypothetical protein
MVRQLQGGRWGREVFEEFIGITGPKAHPGAVLDAWPAQFAKTVLTKGPSERTTAWQ